MGLAVHLFGSALDCPDNTVMGAADSFTASILRSGQAKVRSQDPEEFSLPVNPEPGRFSVQFELDRLDHKRLLGLLKNWHSA